MKADPRNLDITRSKEQKGGVTRTPETSKPTEKEKKKARTIHVIGKKTSFVSEFGRNVRSVHRVGLKTFIKTKKGSSRWTVVERLDVRLGRIRYSLFGR